MDYDAATQSQKPTSRRNVIYELRRLLENRPVGAGQDISVRGEQIGVMIGVWATSAQDAFDVTILVYGRGGQAVELEGIPVALTGDAGRGLPLIRLGKISSRGKDRGHVNFLNIPSGAYSIRFPDSVGESNAAIDFFQTAEAAPLTYSIPTEPLYIAEAPGDLGQSKPGGYETRIDAASPPSATYRQGYIQPQPLKSYMYLSDDGRVTATVRQTENDATFVAFSTETKALASARVHFAFVTTSGKAEVSDIVTLEPNQKQRGVWEGRWEKRISTSAPCRLVFEVFAQESIVTSA